jgi:hypothetical protein
VIDRATTDPGMSLNASFCGFALGAAFGSATVAEGLPEALGFVGAACILARR